MMAELPVQIAMASRGRPLMLERSALDALLAARPRAQLDLPGVPPEEGDQDYSVQQGVAVIPIIGTLFKRGSGIDWLDAMLGIVSTEEIAEALQAALADPAIGAIMLQIDSPGGETRGMFDLADQIRAIRGQKPIIACADDWACSAAYLLASAADQVVISQTGSVGSIGVYAVRVDVTQLDANLGVKVDIIKYGDRKADGNPHTPATDAELADLQAQVDQLGEMFVATVAENRRLTVDAVKATQARVYQGADALPVGLADRVGTFTETLNQLAQAPQGGGESTRRSIPMSQQQEEAVGAAPTAASSTAGAKVIDFAAEKQRLEEKAIAERAAGIAQGTAEANKRLATITNQCMAAKRPDLIPKFAADAMATIDTVAAELAALVAAEHDAVQVGAVRAPTAAPQSLDGLSEAQMLAELQPALVYARRRADLARAQGRTA